MKVIREYNECNALRKKSLGGEKQKMKTKIIVILVALVVLVGIGSAGLVGYLSNTVQTDVTVSSPMEQWNSYDGGTWTKDDLSFPGEKGGQSITFYVKTENIANVAITGNGKNVVENWARVTCIDFTSVSATTTSTYLNPGDVPQNVKDSCTWISDIVWRCGPYPLTCLGIDDYHVEFAYGPTPSITWSAGQVDITKVVVTFKGDADGTYVFTSQILPI